MCNCLPSGGGGALFACVEVGIDDSDTADWWWYESDCRVLLPAGWLLASWSGEGGIRAVRATSWLGEGGVRAVRATSWSGEGA